MANLNQGGTFRRWLPLALFSVMSFMMLLGIVADWRGPQSALVDWQTLMMALFTGTATVAACVFPIHIGYHTKVTMTTVPLFLSAVLLPLPVAVGVTAIAMLAGELLVRDERENLPVDMIITVLRWSGIVLVAGFISNLPGGNPLAQTARLLAAAAAMFVGDAMTTAVHVARLSGESFRSVLRQMVHAGGQVEFVQYVLALLGAFAAFQHFWSPVLLLLPVAIIYAAFKSANELQDSTRLFLETLADTVDLRDPNTGGHSLRVGELCVATLRELGIGGAEADLIISAARVHDIGKIGTPDVILLKAGRLEPDELLIMQAHATRGADMLLRYRDFTRGAEFVRHHHENWDGRGYPSGLAGTAIPFGARVIAVADSYDAMTSTRPYRSPMSPTDAVSLLRVGRGVQWDPRIVDAFLKVIEPRLNPSEAVIPVLSMHSQPLSAGRTAN